MCIRDSQKIALLQNNIDEANQQIGDLEVEIDSQYEQFKNQIRSSYMSPEYSFFCLLHTSII